MLERSTLLDDCEYIIFIKIDYYNIRSIIYVPDSRFSPFIKESDLIKFIVESAVHTFFEAMNKGLKKFILISQISTIIDRERDVEMACDELMWANTSKLNLFEKALF